jgi:hypothetical protein
MYAEIQDLKLEAIVTLDVDGAPTAWEFLVQRVIVDEDGAQLAPALLKRVAATREEIERYIDSAAFALKEDNAARHAQIAALREEAIARATVDGRIEKE